MTVIGVCVVMSDDDLPGISYRESAPPGNDRLVVSTVVSTDCWIASWD